MAEYWQCSVKDYHADMTAIGSSMLKQVLESPKRYHALYVAQTATVEPTPSMILGSAVHCLVLQPNLFDAEFCVKPEGLDGRKKEHKDAWAEWQLTRASRRELTREAYDKAHAIADAVLTSPVVRRWTEGAIIERGIRWEEDGETYKCRPDWLMLQDGQESDYHLDLKTSDDPGPESWLNMTDWGPMAKYRYDLQVSAHYPRGIEAVTGRPCTSGVVVVGVSEPHDIFVYDTAHLRQRGEAWRNKAIRWIRRCRDRGIWEHPAQRMDDEYTGVIEMPAPPEWSFPGGDNE